MTWPVPCGMVQAPPNAVAGAPAMNASAAAAAHQRFGPTRLKNVPPNASYAVRQDSEQAQNSVNFSLASRVNQSRRRKKHNTRNGLRVIWAYGQLCRETCDR